MSLKSLFAEHGVNLPDSLSEKDLAKAISEELEKQEKQKAEALELCRKKELAILQAAMERLTLLIKQDLQKRDFLCGANITFTAEFGKFGLKVVSKGNTVLTPKTYFVNSDGIFSSYKETSETTYEFRQARKNDGV